ncbi:MAG: cupin domain-containing protein [Candidatus Edwardsbacteria bacterium]|nr:cupin domain-containing protein [Candidatus Edwardsbacteria bacterium]
MITITRPSPEELKKLGIETWSPWECEPSEFDWQYSCDETAFVLRGRVVVTTADGEKAEIGPGDLVTFPKGLKCRWRVLERIEKVYRME